MVSEERLPGLVRLWTAEPGQPGVWCVRCERQVTGPYLQRWEPLVLGDGGELVDCVEHLCLACAAAMLEAVEERMVLAVRAGGGHGATP